MWICSQQPANLALHNDEEYIQAGVYFQQLSCLMPAEGFPLLLSVFKWVLLKWVTNTFKTFDETHI